MKALDRKLLRDLRHLGGQILTIALVVACGVASFVALRGNYASLELARTTYYERYGFAAAFASLERAPRSLLADIEAIPGVARAEGRIVEGVLVPLEPGVRPISGRVVSVPPHGASLNRVDLRQGRLLEPGRNDEILLLEGFALARGIEPGHRLPIVLNGRRREMRVVGLVASPEYVFAVAPGDLAADPTRFAVMWMGEEAVAAAFAMEGAFNDVAVTLQPGASERAVLHELDLRLEPYGGLGAYPRARQPSNYMVSGELTQLRSMSSVVPAIFLAVAALLLNLVLSRLVLLQRGEIAALKALGYHSGEIGLHFAKLVVLIALAGAGLGAAAGAWLGAAMTELYQHYFKFPNLEFRFDLSSAIGSLLVTLLASGIGTFAAVRGVLRLAPAEAMQAPPPARYTRSWLDRLELGRLVGTAPQMVLRELRRRPLRTLLSSVAIASSVGLTVVGGFYYDATEELVRTQFFDVMREDVTVTLTGPRPERAVRELGHLPGVLRAEGRRELPVRFRAGHRFRDGVVIGYPEDAELRALRDKNGRAVSIPPGGLVLTDKLAELLGLEVGDRLTLELREGSRAHEEVTLSGLVDESFGLQGHMHLTALSQLVRQEPLVSSVLLQVDPAHSRELHRRLTDLPAVAAVGSRDELLQRFREQSAGMILVFTLIITFFAVTITFGVVYNNARVALSQRSRDLASLRVLGFTRAEVSAMLLGEMGVQVLLAIPLGLFFGRGLVWALGTTMDPETYRLPLLVTVRSYAFATLVTLIASLLSALVVRRKLDSLDLIAVLKTRE
ncbi:MAG: FtsX-like permease family protein [Myxococcales bacterium]|nr:FtsX-like permease family protein [Myxococcales bacterium]